MSSVYAYLQRWFNLTKNQSTAWLIAVVSFLAIGFFVRSSASSFSVYLMASLLFAMNCFLLSLLKGNDRIRLALLASLYVLNTVLFGYYYFSSITIFY